MPLNACLELTVRILFSLLKFVKEEWLFVILLFLVLSFIIKRVTPIFIAIIAEGLNLISDTTLGATFGTSILFSALLGIAIGILWASMILFSVAPLPLQLINMPFMFLLGLLWGIVLIPIPIAAIIIAILLRWKITNYLVAILPSILILAFIFLLPLTKICSGINWVLF